MGETAKTLVGGTVLLGGLGILIMFAAGIPPTPTVWGFRYGFIAITVVAFAVFVREDFRKDLAPDFLRQLFGKPLERDGLCFLIVPAARHGIAYFKIIFQNQYASPCDFRIVISPRFKALGLLKEQFPDVALDLHCDGGAFGVASLPIGIPTNLQGAKPRLVVAAKTTYADGRGKLLRFRNGERVGQADSSGLSSVALTVGLLMLGHLHWKRAVTVACLLPRGVGEVAPASAQIKILTLWTPGDDSTDMADHLRQALLR